MKHPSPDAQRAEAGRNLGHISDSCTSALLGDDEESAENIAFALRDSQRELCEGESGAAASIGEGGSLSDVGDCSVNGDPASGTLPSSVSEGGCRPLPSRRAEAELNVVGSISDSTSAFGDGHAPASGAITTSEDDLGGSVERKDSVEDATSQRCMSDSAAADPEKDLHEGATVVLASWSRRAEEEQRQPDLSSRSLMTYSSDEETDRSDEDPASSNEETQYSEANPFEYADSLAPKGTKIRGCHSLSEGVESWVTEKTWELPGGKVQGVIYKEFDS